MNCFTILSVIAAFIICICIAFGSIKASKYLHRAFLARILRTPMEFFNTTPTGRILNRLTNDVDLVDNMVMHFQQWVIKTIPVLTSIVICAYSSPIILFPIAPLVLFFFLPQVSLLKISNIMK